MSYTKKSLKLKTAFILSLTSHIILSLGLLLSLPFLVFTGGFIVLPIVMLALVIGFSIMIASLIFIKKPETSTKGGIIVLIIGLVSMLAFMIGGGFTFFLSPDPDVPLGHFFLGCLRPLSSIMAIIGGFLGIKEGRKYYYGK